MEKLNPSRSPFSAEGILSGKGGQQKGGTEPVPLGEGGFRGGLSPTIYEITCQIQRDIIRN